MSAVQLSYLLSALRDLALGLAFLYLWWRVLPRQYVLLFGIARLLGVAEASLRLLPHTTIATATLSALGAV
ncbi:MAG TPA: hypothetical protein VI139_05935, partial [Gemmatimonadales bacterium]